MKQAALLVLALAGCSSDVSGSYTIDVESCHGPCEREQPLGVGGNIWVMLRHTDAWGDGAAIPTLVSSDGTVARVTYDQDGYYKVTGLAPGTAELLVLLDGEVAGRTTVTVAASQLTLVPGNGVSGPFVSQDPGIDGEWTSYRGIGFTLTNRVGEQESLGAHYYLVQVDGEDYSCNDTYCVGPVYYDDLWMTLAPGDHEVRFTGLDSGEQHTYRLHVR